MAKKDTKVKKVKDAPGKEVKNEKAASARPKKHRIKNARLFMFWMDLAGVLLLAFALYMGIRYFMNTKFLSAYKAGNYETEIEEDLTKMNLIESYLPYYNLGNVAYKNGEYNRAIAYYKQALEKEPPKYKECPIRVNLALAMIQKIDFNDLSTEKKLQNERFVSKAPANVVEEERNKVVKYNAMLQQVAEQLARLG